MAHPFHHAQSSARKFGGKPEDYQKIHDWFDGSKAFYADFRHRALRHHAEGIFMMESIFGVTVKNSDGKDIPTRLIGEQHVREDLGFIPTVEKWLENIQGKPWMVSNAYKGIEREEKKETPKAKTPKVKRMSKDRLASLNNQVMH